jgi:hypothetical protein
MKFFSFGSLKLEQPMTNATELIVTIANAEMRKSDLRVDVIVPPGKLAKLFRSAIA